LAALAALLLLCSCGTITLSGTESLLNAPKLNQRQEGLLLALESTLNTRGIVYRSPQNGEYRSSFIFFDMDLNGLDEAIVFYSLLSDEAGTTRAKILTQRENGEWAPLSDLPSQSASVDFVRFERLLDARSYCAVIGWQGREREPSTLQVCSMRGGVFNADEFIAPYTGLAVDGAGAIASMVLFSQSGARLTASLVSGVGGYIETLYTLPLCSEAESLLRITGPVDGRIFIDERLSGSIRANVATEIIGIAGLRSLTMLCGGDYEEDASRQTLARENYEMTVRDEDILCADYDGDSEIDVPYPTALPGNAESGLLVPSLMRFLRFNGYTFESGGAAVVNAEAGYLVNFPERWIDNVTVEYLPEIGEWRFRKWDHDMLESSDELLRVRVSSSQDYLDSFVDYTELEERSALTYSAYIPAVPGEPLAVSEPEVRRLFRLL
jgi:hypothetical protein